MDGWKKCGVVVVVTAALFAGNGIAAADAPDAGTVTGGDVSGPGSSATPGEQRQADAKLAFAEAYYAAKYEGGSAADLRAAAARYESAYPRSGDESIEGLATVAGSRGVAQRSARAAALSESRMLPMVHKGQLKSYYCGPASGKMMLDTLGAGPSEITGEVKNQNNIADASHMRTDINGKTAWDSGLFRVGLNKWRQGSASGYYVQHDAPTYPDFKRMLVADVDRDYPIAADTVEWPTQTHYNNHPRLPDAIGHWIVGFGYTQYGDVARFADPSSSIWSQYEVRETFTTMSERFSREYLDENGIVW